MIKNVITAILVVACVAMGGVALKYNEAYNASQEELEYLQDNPTIVEVHVLPVEFPSKAALLKWLEENNIDAHEYIPTTYDCDDFAYDLMQAAIADGYLMSTQTVLINGNHHMMNATIIGNEVYLIEPQTDTVWLNGLRD